MSAIVSFVGVTSIIVVGVGRRLHFVQYGSFYVTVTPNIMVLFYVLSFMGLSYVPETHNIMGPSYAGNHTAIIMSI